MSALGDADECNLAAWKSACCDDSAALIPPFKQCCGVCSNHYCWLDIHEMLRDLLCSKASESNLNCVHAGGAGGEIA